jgi:hypothetical protein
VADIRRNPVADRPATGTSHAGVSGAAGKCGKRRREKHASVRAKRDVLAFRCYQASALIAPCSRRPRFAVVQGGQRGHPDYPIAGNLANVGLD